MMGPPRPQATGRRPAADRVTPKWMAGGPPPGSPHPSGASAWSHHLLGAEERPLQPGVALEGPVVRAAKSNVSGGGLVRDAGGDSEVSAQRRPLREGVSDGSKSCCQFGMVSTAESLTIGRYKLAL